jgi:hypothetical protein
MVVIGNSPWEISFISGDCSRNNLAQQGSSQAPPQVRPFSTGLLPFADRAAHGLQEAVRTRGGIDPLSVSTDADSGLDLQQ